ncbi:hypothetical protein ACFQZ2_20730, partial [Streptomonospora algeriensis]
MDNPLKRKNEAAAESGADSGRPESAHSGTPEQDSVGTSEASAAAGTEVSARAAGSGGSAAERRSAS